MASKSRPRIVKADEAGIAAAVDVLRSGGLVALPTETVYGLAARADQEDAVAGIYRAKGRPSFNPLIVHVPDLRTAADLAIIDERAEALAGAFWPGALTMVLPRRGVADLADAVTAGLPSVALRCPAHPVMCAVLAQSGLALAAPSANRSGAVSPTSAEHVRSSLGDAVDLIVDGGACTTGLESTIVGLRDGGGWSILRPGPITASQIEAVLRRKGEANAVLPMIEAPGQLESHYAPGKPVRLGAVQGADDEFLIGFGSIVGDVSLSRTGDLNEAASRLYACLHEASAAPQPRVAVASVPDTGIGAAINDRLRRAAT